MKQLLMALLLALFVAPSALAHTQLSSTAPAHGDVVTMPLTEISLTYAGQIEEGSHFDLTNANGEAIKIVSLTVLNGVMTGTVAEPLANGDYTVQWDSISADGHPLNGTFSFSVNVPGATQPTDVAEPAVTNEEEQKDASEGTAGPTEEPAEESSNTGILIVVAIFVVIIVASLVVLFTRRKG